MAVTREDILEAVETCKRMGEDFFLKHFGFGKATKYLLQVQGAYYPSKAILGVAVGMSAKDFSGGIHFTVRILKRLGFKIKEKITEKVKRFIEFARGIFLPFPSIAIPFTLPTNPVSIFFSGLTNEGEIEGCIHTGFDIGVSACTCRERTENALKDQLLGTDIQLFVDSGAFSEMKFKPVPHVVKPMTDAVWQKVMELYYRLACDFGENVHVVVPDRVLDQKVTLERMKTYADYMLGLLYMGARVLVPVQKGALSQTDFFAEACKTLDVNPDDVTPALPCKQGATLQPELEQFVKDVQPKKLHLLGMGPHTQTALPFLKTIAKYSPHTLVQIDSCMIRAQVGRKDGPKITNGVKRLTYCQDLVVERTNIEYKDVANKKSLAFIMAYGDYCQFKPDGNIKIPAPYTPKNLLVGEQVIKVIK